MTSPRVTLALLGILLVLRAVMAGLLPLTADEAYYWLWSQHLAWGYFDHPPMIAWLPVAQRTVSVSAAIRQPSGSRRTRRS